jgi:hypothetical protein
MLEVEPGSPLFYTKVHDHLLRPLIAADQPPAPPEIRRGMATIDRHVHLYTDRARLGAAAQKSSQTP